MARRLYGVQRNETPLLSIYPRREILPLARPGRTRAELRHATVLAPSLDRVSAEQRSAGRSGRACSNGCPCRSLVVAQLASLASCRWPSHRLTAMRPRGEWMSRPGPNRWLRCVLEARPKSLRSRLSTSRLLMNCGLSRVSSSKRREWHNAC